MAHKEIKDLTTKILNAKAIASGKLPSEIIASMLRNELTAVHAHG